MTNDKYILAFDTANEQIAIGIGKCVDNFANILNAENNIFSKFDTLKYFSLEKQAHRASNTLLIPSIDNLCKEHNINHKNICCIAAGKGPGSFTGVRISLASAKGIANALNVPLVGLNTLDAVAWNAWISGLRGHVYVVADAMRKEIYPALFKLDETGIKRLTGNKVLKAELVAKEAKELSTKCDNFYICGDALCKYLDIFDWGQITNQELWSPCGQSLLLSYQQIKNNFLNETPSKVLFNPSIVLPIYTRLSDAEENERTKLASIDVKNLQNGVGSIRDSENNNIIEQIQFVPMTKNDVSNVVSLETQLMQSDAWNTAKFDDEFNYKNRSWWIAKHRENVVGYIGGMFIDDKLEILKIAVNKNYQNNKIASKLLEYLFEDAKNLAATKCLLEVRQSNKAAQNFYYHHNFCQIAVRPNYYKNEDALILTRNLDIQKHDIAGMQIETNKNSSTNIKQGTTILAIESSCDETAAAISINGQIIADVVASQIKYHKRFGGVVPEIASRKHIEAICGVCEKCFEITQKKLADKQFSWNKLDAVAATYAPGLVGALVIGMAYVKGSAWALNKPLIGVNHLEGHLYANKFCRENIELPAIASIISGGNTMLVHVKDWGDYTTLGTTVDDAVGEAFDKVAKVLGLGYPGGPAISKLAEKGDSKSINFPRAMINSKDFKFSLSGLKTAVINYINNAKNINEQDLANICASFEQAIIDVQVLKAKEALKTTHSKSFLFGGGVAANKNLRDAYKNMCDKEGINLVMAPLSACGDNAAMIALVANKRYAEKKFFELSADVCARTNLDEAY